jgi:hypothetical protein
MIAAKLQEKLPEKMGEQFESKGLKVDITVKNESDEAEFFFDCIRGDS